MAEELSWRCGIMTGQPADALACTVGTEQDRGQPLVQVADGFVHGLCPVLQGAIDPRGPSLLLKLVEDTDDIDCLADADFLDELATVVEPAKIVLPVRLWHLRRLLFLGQPLERLR